MNPVAIIPSKTMSNLLPCLQAVRKHESDARVIVIDDGLDWGGVDISCDWLTAIPGAKPFVFARNCNLGIRHALESGAGGVALLNDDALLESSGGFSLLAREAEEHPEFGIVGVTTNLTGQPLQKRRNVGLRDVDHIAFVGVYIPRRTLETVGLLDERFVTYGSDDRDYCHRVKLAGLKVGVHDGCYVDHGSLRSSFRGDPKAAADIRPGQAIFRAKWGQV